MRHHTRTVSDSQCFASRSTWAQLAAGIGQGNGAGPAIWVVVSSPLFAIMKEDGFLTLVICTMMHMVVSIGSFAFVNNTNLCVLGHHTAEKTAKHMQQLITHWEGLL